MAVRLHGQRFVLDLAHLAALEDMTLLPGQALEQPRQIFERVKLRLVGEANSRSLNKRNRVKVLRLESQFRRRVGRPSGVFCDQPCVESARGSVQIARNPGEIAVQVLLLDVFVDLVDGGSACVPCGLRVVAPETIDELVKAQVGDESEMRGRVTGVAAAAAVALQQGDRATCLLEQDRRRSPP